MGLRLSRLRVSTDPLPSPPVPSCPTPPVFHRLLPTRILSSAPPHGAARTSLPCSLVLGHPSVPGHREDEYPARRAESAREESAEAREPLPPAARLSAGGGKSRAALAGR